MTMNEIAGYSIIVMVCIEDLVVYIVDKLEERKNKR